MHDIDTTIGYVQPGSIAEEAGICAGDKLLAVNGHRFMDILEYRYLISEYEVELLIEKQDGTQEELIIETDYEDLGIEFKRGLIDIPQQCTNQCIFCFIDQLPKGMRSTVYFKDDDTRLSFLQGNYVTLTNLKDSDIQRLIDMRISPINISVHTTNPKLREKMLGNRFAGRIYDIMRRFAAEKLYMNCQIVLCPGINDKSELDRTITDLTALYPYINSIAIVPVGLTAHREGLYPLEMFDVSGSHAVIRQVQKYQQMLFKQYGTRLVYLSDEFYLNARMPIPEPEQYEGFPQIENGVGLIASLNEEFLAAVDLIPPKKRAGHIMLVTGELAYPLIKAMAEQMMKKAPGIMIDTYAVENRFFGGGVNVAGLVCGCDIIRQIQDKPKCDKLLLPSVMLRDGDAVFLDDTTVDELERALEMPVVFVDNDGYDFVEKVLGEELQF